MVHGTRDRRRAAKVNELLDTGLELVAEQGLEGLTIAALAKRMDWTKGAMYRYFRGKDQLIAALNARVLGAWDAAATEALRDVTAPRARLDVLMHTLIDMAHEQPHAFGLISLTLADPRNLVESIDDAVHIPAMMALLGRITTEIEACELTPGDSLQRAFQLVFGVIGVLQLRKLARFSPAFDADRLARSTAHDLLSSWSLP